MTWLVLTGRPVRRDASSEAAWGMTVGDLETVLMEAMRVRRHRRRHPPDAQGEHVGSAATVVGLHGSGKKPRAHLRWDHHGGVFPREAAHASSVGFRGASARGRFRHVEFCGPIFTRPGFPAPVREYYDVIPLTRAPHAAEGPHHDRDGFFPRKSSAPRSGGRTPLVERGPNGIVPSRVAACRRRCARL